MWLAWFRADISKEGTTLFFRALSHVTLPTDSTEGEVGTHTHNKLEYAAIALATKHINKHTGTIPVILARHWLRLPDDGSYVNRNMSEQILYF